ncbi:MAG TPA: efflux RND transporter permease subunit [Propionibacteriaceae bacterium]|nr:efflux RND transporter permease subunit [Propionibacteriaceae bacterium]
MIKWIVSAALRFSRLVVAVAIGILGVGLFQLHNAAVDVYPEFEPPDIQIQAEALGLSAQEVEQLITVPLEQDLLNGIPWVEHIRSRSMPGLSAIDLQFEPGTDLLAARQLTQERMSQAKALPNVGTPPIMVQPTSSTSRIAMIAMRSDSVSEVQMSVLARWIIKPRLMSIPGVANVSVWGMRDRQLQVQVDPGRLQSRKVSLTQLIESTGNALWVSPLSFVEASTPGTGGFVETPNQRLGVQHIQPITTPDQLANVAVEGTQSPTLRIGDVANVIEDHQPLIGDASLDGAPSLMLVVERFPDANTAQVTSDVDEALDAMAPGLAGIDMDANVFRPASYMTTALGHLGVAGLVSAVLLVAAVGLLFVSWRAVLIPVVAVPLSLVSAAWVLHLRGETLTTMTLLGLAAATAVVVDDVMGDVAAIRSRQLTLGPDRPRLSSVMGDLVTARRGPLLVASVVAILVLAPVLAIGGVWNAFSWPFAATYVLTIVTSLVVALIVTPALAVLLLRDGQQELRAGPLDRLVRRAADRVGPAINKPGWVVFALGVLAVVSILGATLAPGGPVLPTLQDRNLLVRVQGAPGTSLTEMNRITSTVATELRGAPGIESAGAHVGRAITSDEIVDVNAGEIWLTVAPDADYDATLAGVRDIAAGYPGLQTSVRTYAEDRVAAVREKVGDELVVRVYGADFATLQDTADDVASMLSTVSGVLTPRVEPQVTEPTLEIEVDLAAAQRHGLRPGDVRREATTLISGLAVGNLFDEQKVFDVVVWGGPGIRQSLSDLEALRIDTPSGTQVRLGEVAKVRIAPDPVAIDHNSVSRSLDVTAVVNGRSPADVSQEVTSRLRGISFPYEYRAEVLGDAVQQQADHRRVAAIAGVVVLLSFLILQAATGSWGLAAALLVTLPVAVTGGVLVAPLVGGVRSIGVLVALFALLALAIRQALVFLRRARELGEEPGASPDQAVRQAVREVAPSVIGVALVMAALLVAPAVMGTTAGLEALQPFAVSMLAGLVTATVVSLIAVPAFYLAIANRALSKEKGRPAATSPVPGFETEVSS